MAEAIVAPGVEYVQLPGKSTVWLDPRFLDFHTMVGTLAGTQSWFTPSGRAYSHFGIGIEVARQWQDLRYKAASDLEGNPWSISFETQDMGSAFGAWSGSDVPAWLDSQMDLMAPLAAWCCIRFGIPAVDVTNSLPVPQGLSIHRYGIDPYRVMGGLRYSNSFAKACPGDRRVHQFKTELVPEIARLVGGVIQPPPPTTEKYEMPYPVIFCRDRGPTYWVLTEAGPKAMPGGAKAFDWYKQGVAGKILLPVQDLSAPNVPSKTTLEFDQRFSLCRDLALAPAGQ